MVFARLSVFPLTSARSSGLRGVCQPPHFFCWIQKLKIFGIKVVWCQSLAGGVGCGHGLVMVEYITPRSPLMDSYLKFYILKPIQDSEQNLFFSSTMSHAPSTKKIDMAVLFFLGWLCLFYPLKPIIGKTYRVSHKKLLAQCCWSSISSNRHPSLLAILTRLGPEIIFW